MFKDYTFEITTTKSRDQWCSIIDYFDIQVCSILWSSSYRELVSGHGFSKNQLTLWKYPSMDRIADLVGHEARILSLAMSPDGSMVASSSADETVRLWKCFPIEKKEVTSNVKAKDTMQALTTGIRWFTWDKAMA